MICPKCNQPSGKLTDDGHCPLCGCDLRVINRRVMVLYLLGLAFFLSVVIYAGLVYLFDTQGLRPAGTLGTPWLPHVMLLIAVLLFGLAWKMGQRLHIAASSLAVQRLYVTKLALVESIVILGLFVYFATGSIQLFVTFLALGVLGFIFAGAQLPALVHRLGQLCIAEQERPDASSQIEE